MNLELNNILIAYFSRRGDNFVGGEVAHLTSGNTEVVARMIHDAIGGTLFEIQSDHAYPDDYHKTAEAAKQEKQTNARPSLAAHVENMNDFDTVFLGFPNWWGTMPMPVYTFLEEHDLSGKTILPFCTHEGSGIGRSEREISRLCPEANILKGLAIHGSIVDSAKPDIMQWLSSSGRE